MSSILLIAYQGIIQGIETSNNILSSVFYSVGEYYIIYVYFCSYCHMAGKL
jgi:hypothetical protein